MLRITPFESRDMLMHAAAASMKTAIAAGISQRGAACLALSGGTTPEPAYKLLATLGVDWRYVTFALVDERFVPAEHSASNEGMLRRALAPALAPAPPYAAKLLPMYAPLASVDDAATRADALYASLLIDIAVMGMGADGHTASWFPNAVGLAEALDPNTPRNVVAVRAPHAAGAPERLTLTLPALARAERVLLLISGKEKRARLEQAVRDEDAPVAALFKLPLNAEVLWAA